ncbi:MAG: 4-phosphopantetheinyl transferase family protein, partial [Verrucomicrobia bacterium]|nr:4-phosphopantetheinyl transferase family protein [Deltaproteobacteria bacterium]
LALAERCQLGIDLEQLREDLPFKAMAQQFFSRREQADLFSLPAGLQPAAFYRCWTRKEAYLKGVGSGFSQPADLCDVSLLPDQPPALLAHRSDPEQPSKWSLIDLDVPIGFCAALAIQESFGAYAAFSQQKSTELIYSRG